MTMALSAASDGRPSVRLFRCAAALRNHALKNVKWHRTNGAAECQPPLLRPCSGAPEMHEINTNVWHIRHIYISSDKRTDSRRRSLGPCFPSISWQLFPQTSITKQNKQALVVFQTKQSSFSFSAEPSKDFAIDFSSLMGRNISRIRPTFLAASV